MTQLARYVIIGTISNATGYLVYFLLTFLFVGPKLAMTVVYLTAALIGFLGNRRWTFSYKGNILPIMVKYIFAHFLCYSMNLSILYIFVDRMSYSHLTVQAVAIGLCAGFLFLLLKKVVFIDSMQNCLKEKNADDDH
jgi:putative flippase GtrA